MSLALDWQVEEAERFKAEDDANKSRIDSKNSLENYVLYKTFYIFSSSSV